jgi:catecholate siderophore receptor
LSASIYRTINDNEVTQDVSTGNYFQQGKTQVEGIELGAAGQLTANWQINAGLAMMDTEAQNKVSRSVNATTGVVTITETANVRWSPDLTATVWSDYTWQQFKLGAGVRYVSDQKRVVSKSTVNGVLDTTPANMPEIPAYWVADAAVSYTVNKQATVALNLYNLFDEEYINTLNNSGARMTLGQPRSAKLSLNYKF